MTIENTAPKHSFIRIRTVISRTGLPESTIAKLVNDNEFPSPVKLSKRAVGFIEAEVDQWINDKIEVHKQKLKNSNPCAR